MRIGGRNSFGFRREQRCQNLMHPFAPGFSIQRLVCSQDFADLVSDSHCRMKGGRRLLIDQRDAPAANALQLPRCCLQDVPAVETYAALLNLSVCWKQAKQRSGKSPFTRTVFSNTATNFSGP